MQPLDSTGRLPVGAGLDTGYGIRAMGVDGASTNIPIARPRRPGNAALNRGMNNLPENGPRHRPSRGAAAAHIVPLAAAISSVNSTGYSGQRTVGSTPAIRAGAIDPL